MDTQAEQSTTGQNRDGPSDAAAETVAAQDDRDEEIARLEDRWRRAVADLDNLRKRYARELEHERTTERSKVAGAWLPIVDNLERAISHAGDESSAVLDGVRNIVREAVQVLEHLGYPRDAETGVPFDPERHEVVGVVDQPDRTPGTILDVIRPGYGEGSRQLRPAAVVVSRREG
jgi:molecular chaperone GrpE